MIFAFGKFAIQSFVYIKKLGWKPKQVFVNAVAAATSVMQLASTSGQTEGAISSPSSRIPPTPHFDKDKGMKLYKSISRSTETGEARTGVEV